MWLALVTDVDQATARNLVDSMNNEVIVQDDPITRLLPGELMGYDDAVRLALQERAAEAKRRRSDRQTQPDVEPRTRTAPTPIERAASPRPDTRPSRRRSRMRTWPGRSAAHCARP